MGKIVDGNYATFTAGGTVVAFRRVKVQADGTIVHSGAGEAWIGTSQNGGVTGDLISVKGNWAAGTHKMTATTAFACGADLYGTANGMVDDVGTGDIIGTALEAATALNDTVEVDVFRRAGATYDQLWLAVDAVGSGVGVGIPFTITFRPTAAGTLTYTVPAGKKLRILSILPCYKAGGNGAHADDEVTLKNAANAITDTKELGAINDKVIFNFTTIDDACTDIAAAGTLNCVTNENAANGCDCVIPVVCCWTTV
jgi:hypothetical protein